MQKGSLPQLSLPFSPFLTDLPPLLPYYLEQVEKGHEDLTQGREKENNCDIILLVPHTCTRSLFFQGALTVSSIMLPFTSALCAIHHTRGLFVLSWG